MQGSFLLREKAHLVLTDVQETVLGLLRKYGRNLHSFEVLEPGLSYWLSDDGEAAVAYAARGWYWVAAGSPICDRGRLSEVALAFAATAHAQGRGAAFFGVSERFLQALDRDCFDWLQIGLQPVWDPRVWPEAMRGSPKLRNRLRRAEREGLRVRLASLHEFAEGTPLRRGAEELVDTWIESHPLPPMRFMLTLDLFTHAETRRYFIAEENGRLVGLAVAVPIYGHQGWLVEDMIIDRRAAHGTSEALVDQAMRSLAEEGSPLVTLGMVALAGVQNWEAAGRHPVLSWILRFCHRTMDWLYGFQGLFRFRSKLMPQRWEPVYLVAYRRVTFMTVRAVLMAFAGGWVPAFATRVAGRILGRWVRAWRRSPGCAK